jgi:sugar phosphate isomerase/epimerase
MSEAISRRGFLTGSLAAAAVACARPAAAREEPPAGPICAFTKFLQPLSYEQLAETIAELGFDGVEATVRAGGHVLPERVEEDLPKLVEALQNHGLDLTVMTSDVSRVDQQHSEAVLRTAASLGIERYRMGYYTYDLQRPVRAQRDAYRPAIRELAAMNRELGLQGLYQNHAGARYVGATVWDFQELIQDIPPAEIAIAFDIRHAVAEAGFSWPVLLNLAEPHLGALFVKDFRWQGDRAENVPLGEGRVDRRFLTRVGRFRGPISLHVEYLQRAGVEPNIAALGTDLATLRQWLSEAAAESP